MRPSRRPIIIATRRSPLAQAQAQAVGRALKQLNPNVEIELMPVVSQGDRMQDLPLNKTLYKGSFTGTVEALVLNERADVAVHSLKDLPVANTAGLVLAAIPMRGDVADCLIAEPGVRSLSDLQPGATVGTSSGRRAAQILRQRPDVKIAALRGNINTRLAKVLEEKVCDATLLAAAGLQRGGLAEYATCPLDTDLMLPAAGQAALAIQCRADDHVTLRRCLPLNHPMTATCVEAERHIVAALGADCHTPMAALAEPVDGDRLRLRARVLSADGQTCLEADETAPTSGARRLAKRVATALIDQGAKALLVGRTQPAPAAGD